MIDNHVRATNLPWTVNARILERELDVPKIVLMNDLGATGHSIEHLAPEEFSVLNPGKPEPGGTMALLAAGTGLGQSISGLGSAQRYRIVPSEGGHSDFAPHTEQQIELLRFMRRRYPQVSWELILSGRGFRTLHEFLAPEVKHATFEDPDADPAPEITRNGSGRDMPGVRGNAGSVDFDLWRGSGESCAEGAGAGWRLCRRRDRGEDHREDQGREIFCSAFRDKWKFESVLENIPVSVVLNESAPLLGAAYEALASVRK